MFANIFNTEATMRNTCTAKLTIIVSNAILKRNEFTQLFQSARVVAVLFFFSISSLTYRKVNNVGISLVHIVRDPLRSPSVAAGGSHVAIDTDRTEQFRRNARGSERYPSPIRGLEAGATRTDDDRCGRRGGGGGDGEGDGHHRVCRRRSAMRHSTHNTRRTFPQHDAAATNVPARSFVASHRAAVPTSPSLFSTVAYGRCRPARIDICDSMSVDNEEVGDRVVEANRPAEGARLSWHAVVIRRLIVPLVDPGICRRILSRGGVASAFLERRKRRGKEKDWKAKEILVRFRLNRSR